MIRYIIVRTGTVIAPVYWYEDASGNGRWIANLNRATRLNKTKAQGLDSQLGFGHHMEAIRED